jgi:nucleotide-binding universal stress UspA family protein
MLRSILVPLDGSPLAERALAYATALSIPTGARLVLVRTAAAGPDADVPWTASTAAAKRYLMDIARDLKQRGFACELAAPSGRPAECVLAEEHTHRADLIVMSTHGRTGPGRWLFGSVAEAVVASSPVPVLVERAWQPVRREPLLSESPGILVPLDGSPFAESALEPAAALAEDLGAALILLRVEDRPSDVLSDEYGRPVAYLDRQENWARTRATNYLDTAANHMAEHWPGVAVRSDVRLGDPATAIAEAAASASAALVFMATHGRTGVRRAIMGSVAGQVLERSGVPLVLIRPPAPSTPDDAEAAARQAPT